MDLLARAVRSTIEKMEPGEAVAFSRMVFAEGIAYDLTRHGEEIRKTYAGRAQAMRQDLTRQVIRKSLRGEDTALEERAFEVLEGLAKAADPNKRDWHGRFAHVDSRNRIREVRDYSPQGYARRVGDTAAAWQPKEGDRTTSLPFRRLQAGTSLLTDTFGPVLPSPVVTAAITADYVSQFGPSAASVVIPAADKASYRYRGIERHEVDPELAANMAGLRQVVAPDADVLAAPGKAKEAYEAKLAANAARVERVTAEAKALAKEPNKVRAPIPVPIELRTEDGASAQEKARVADHNTRRLQTIADNRRAAAATGITPGQARERITRAQAYRVGADQKAQAEYLAEQAGARGKVMAERARLFRERRQVAIHGLGTDERGRWLPGPVVSYWRRQLPKADLIRLQTSSGTLPPSQGMIVDKTGKVVSQSAGYGEDWYTPFNLAKLKNLQGGEYIRTRTFGGPTTEDIYTGLLHGARAVTVVSHSGSFTIEFDDALTGGRRFNDKALRMTQRYGQLLDAVRSGQVQLGAADPAMEAEMEARAARSADPVSDKARYQRLMAAQRKELHDHPRLSQEKYAEVAEAFLTEHVAGRHKARTADTTLDQAIEQAVTRRARDLAAETAAHASGFGFTPDVKVLTEENRAALLTRLQAGTPTDRDAQVADLLGVRTAFDAHMKAAAIDTVRQSEPLVLNGRGYDMAMKALKDQFPYYIQKTTWHEWPRDASGAIDQGYVRPGRNRPVAARTGLYGEGTKGPADAVRFQPAGADKVGTVQGDPAVASPAAGTPASPQVAALKAEYVKSQNTQANLAWLRWLRSQTNFGTEAKDPAHPGMPIATADIAEGLRVNTFPADLRSVYAPDQAELEAKVQAGDPTIEALLRRVHTYVTANKTFDVPKDVSEAFTRRGLPAEAVSTTKANWQNWLNDVPHTFTGTAYTAAASPADIAEEYRVLNTEGLPGRLPWTDADEKAVTAREQTLRTEVVRMITYLNTPGSEHLVAPMQEQLSGQAEDLARARALNRSYRQADDRERAARDAEAARAAQEAADTPAPVFGTLADGSRMFMGTAEQVQQMAMEAARRAMEAEAEEQRRKGGP